MRASSAGDLVPVGKVLRPHGTRGLLRILPYAGSDASFTEAEEVVLRLPEGGMRCFSVVSLAPHQRVYLMRLAGVGSGGEAERFRGAEILVRKDALVRGEGEFFYHELVGIRVFRDSGEYLGRVSRIIPTGANDIYEVKEGKREVLIPATREVVREIDLKNGKMIVSPMEGLLELNEV